MAAPAKWASAPCRQPRADRRGPGSPVSCMRGHSRPCAQPVRGARGSRICLGIAGEPPVDVADSPAKAHPCRSKLWSTHGLRLERGGAEQNPRENMGFATDTRSHFRQLETVLAQEGLMHRLTSVSKIQASTEPMLRRYRPHATSVFEPTETV